MKWNLLHFALLFLLISLYNSYAPLAIRNVPTIKLLLPFLISTIMILPFHNARSTLSWFKAGKIDRKVFVLMCATAVISVFAVILWAMWSKNIGFSVQFAKGFMTYPKWLILILGVPLFAVANAFAEEAVYRGVLQEALSHLFAQRHLILILQASAFGAAHFAVGFPNGYSGFLMTFVYGYVLGYLRMISQGLLAPYLTHVVADLSIGYYVCFKVF